MQKNFILTWSANCVIAYCTASNQATTFVITDTKLLVPLESLSTNDNAKLLQQLKQNSMQSYYNNWNRIQTYN